MDEPVLIGPIVDQVLNEVLPESIAKERVRLLARHTDDVLALRNHAREVYERRFLEVAEGLMNNGWPGSAAYDVARERLADERRIMEQELEEQLDVLKDRLRHTIEQLCASLNSTSEPSGEEPIVISG